MELHPKKGSNWCGFLNEGIIGPFFFENDVGEAITVNGERYGRVTSRLSLLWLKLDEINVNVDGMWFQQGSATSHTEAFEYLRKNCFTQPFSHKELEVRPAASGGMVQVAPLEYF